MLAHMLIPFPSRGTPPLSPTVPAVSDRNTATQEHRNTSVHVSKLCVYLCTELNIKPCCCSENLGHFITPFSQTTSSSLDPLQCVNNTADLILSQYV